MNNFYSGVGLTALTLYRILSIEMSALTDTFVVMLLSITSPAGGDRKWYRIVNSFIRSGMYDIIIPFSQTVRGCVMFPESFCFKFHKWSGYQQIEMIFIKTSHVIR